MKKYSLVILIFMSCMFFSCSDKADIESIQTTPVKKRTLSTSVISTGIVRPQTGAEVKVGSRISGIVSELSVNVGDRVTKGELLARLDETELRAEFNQAVASRDRAGTVLKYAKIEMLRLEKLLEKDFTSQQSYDNSVKEFEMAQNLLNQAEANLDYATVQLSYTSIYAPTSGVVASISTQEGETIAAMFAAPTFLTIIDLNRLEVRVYVDETDIGKIAIGQKALFNVDTYNDVNFEGIVKTIYPKAEILDNVVNYIAIVEITNTQGKLLRPEMTTTVEIITDSEDDALTVPNTSIIRSEGKYAVYTVTNEGLKKKSVDIGERGKIYTQIISGIEEGEQVVVNGMGISNN